MSGGAPIQGRILFLHVFKKSRYQGFRGVHGKENALPFLCIGHGAWRCQMTVPWTASTTRVLLNEEVSMANEKFSEELVLKEMHCVLGKNDFGYVFPQGDVPTIAKIEALLKKAGGKPDECALKDSLMAVPEKQSRSSLSHLMNLTVS